MEPLEDIDDGHRRVTGGTDKGGRVVRFGLLCDGFVGSTVAELVADQPKIFCAAVIGQDPKVTDPMKA